MFYKKICKKCKKDFLGWKKTSTFCSISCANRVNKIGNTYRNYLIPIKCLYCHKEFKPINYRIRYCSRSCILKGKPSFRKGKECLAIRGEKHHNWKGGISKLHHSERELAMFTVKYKLWRSDVFERDEYTCQMCGQKGGKLEAHHIKSWVNFPELRYEINNGSTLCKNCHKKLGNKERNI